MRDYYDKLIADPDALPGTTTFSRHEQTRCGFESALFWCGISLFSRSWAAMMKLLRFRRTSHVVDVRIVGVVRWSSCSQGKLHTVVWKKMKLHHPQQNHYLDGYGGLMWFSLNASRVLSSFHALTTARSRLSWDMWRFCIASCWSMRTVYFINSANPNPWTETECVRACILPHAHTSALQYWFQRVPQKLPVLYVAHLLFCENV